MVKNNIENKSINILLDNPTLVVFPSHSKEIVVPKVLEALKMHTDSLIYWNEAFYFYNSVFWERISDAAMKQFLREYALKIGCPETKAKCYWAVDDLLKQAKLDLSEEVSRDKRIMNFPNGSLNLDTLEFREHRKEDYVTFVLPYDYDSEAKCPKWEKFLSEVLQSQALRFLLQEGFAYPLTTLKLDKVICLFGDGLNGKSVALEILARLVGKENVSHVTLSQITHKECRFFAPMLGRLVNISAETSKALFEESAFKTYTSREYVSVKNNYYDPFNTDDYPQSIIAMNNLPIVDDFSVGQFRRYLWIPFNYQIPKDKINIHLTDELTEELPGIFNWLLEGIRRLNQNNGFTNCEESELLSKQFRMNSDNVSLFFDDKNKEPSPYNKELLKEVYSSFSEWSRENGYKELSNKSFSTRAKQLKYRVEKGTGNKVYIWLQEKQEEIDEINELPF